MAILRVAWHAEGGDFLADDREWEVGGGEDAWDYGAMWGSGLPRGDRYGQQIGGR